MKIKKGDKILVTVGKDSGKEAVVERVSDKKGKVFIAGVNVYKRHVKKNEQMNFEGGIMEIIKPINISNVALICPSCKKVTRVGFKVEKNGKFRICKKCGKEISNEQVKG